MTDYEPDAWGAFAPEWERWCSENAALGYSSAAAATSRAGAKLFPILAKQGVMRRAANGRYIVHRERFPAAAFAALTTTEPDPLEAVA